MDGIIRLIWWRQVLLRPILNLVIPAHVVTRRQTSKEQGPCFSLAVLYKTPIPVTCDAEHPVKNSNSHCQNHGDDPNLVNIWNPNESAVSHGSKVSPAYTPVIFFVVKQNNVFVP